MSIGKLLFSLYRPTVRSCCRSAPFSSVLHRHPTSSNSPPGVLLFRFSEYSTAALPRDDEEIRSMFEDWMKKFNKSYDSSEEKERRFEIFKEKVHRADEHNRPENGHSFRIGINKFSDLPLDEFRRIYLTVDRVHAPDNLGSLCYDPKERTVKPYGRLQQFILYAVATWTFITLFKLFFS